MGDDVNTCTFGTIDSAIERCKGSPLYSSGGPCCLGGNYLYHVKLREGSVVCQCSAEATCNDCLPRMMKG